MAKTRGRTKIEKTEKPYHRDGEWKCERCGALFTFALHWGDQPPTFCPLCGRTTVWIKKVFPDPDAIRARRFMVKYGRADVLDQSVKTLTKMFKLAYRRGRGDEFRTLLETPNDELPWRFRKENRGE